MMSNSQIMNVTIILLLIYVSAVNSDNPSLCAGNGWIAYQEEKCFKVLNDTLRNFKDALGNCSIGEIGASLASIQSIDEQNFLNNLLFSNDEIVDEVWIGLEKKNGKFVWIDNSPYNFEYWESGHPILSKANNNCTQMIHDSTHLGRWVDESCNKKNLAVCQKSSDLSVDYIKRRIETSRDLFNFTRDEFKQRDIKVFIDEVSSDRWMYFATFNESVNGANHLKVLIVPKKDNSVPQSFNNSYDICRKYNSELVEIPTWEKQMVLNSFFFKLRFELRDHKRFWLGGKIWEGKLSWPISHDSSFANWMGTKNETRSLMGIELLEGKDFGKWFNSDDFGENYVICEYQIKF